MSIDRDTFENTSEDELEDLSVPDQVLGFLAANDDRAFKAREIASQIGVDEGAVSTALSRLKDRDLVEHKATYWAVTDDAERLDGYSGYERATALFNDQLGTEDKKAWREHGRSLGWMASSPSLRRAGFVAGHRTRVGSSRGASNPLTTRISTSGRGVLPEISLKRRLLHSLRSFSRIYTIFSFRKWPSDAALG